MSDITFYTNPQSRGQTVHWMLEELGVAYDTQWIEYVSRLQTRPAAKHAVQINEDTMRSTAS